jgi:hypothetical protein
MKPLLVLLIALLVASTASAEDRIFRVSMVAAMAAHGADLASTEWCLGAGTCRETNRVLGRFSTQPATFGAVKIGVAALSLWGTAKLHESHPKIAIALNLGVAAFFTGIAVHNTRAVR